MLYDSNLEIDITALRDWSNKSIQELEELRADLYKRINHLTEYSESLDQGFTSRIEQLDKYIMYRKGLLNEEDLNGKKTIIL